MSSTLTIGGSAINVAAARIEMDPLVTVHESMLTFVQEGTER
jgi:hypothetical protein